MVARATSGDLSPSAYSVGGLQRTSSHKRSSMSAYIEEGVEVISARISRAMNLRPSVAPIQVMRYKLGGGIQPHLDTRVTSNDFYKTSEAETQLIQSGGDRLATMMLYLSEPKSGGFTTFPQLGITLPPKQGSALAWFTLKTSGRPDSRMLHMGCPVLQGTKWIANRWENWVGQMWTHPCHRDRNQFSLRPRSQHQQRKVT